MPSFQRYDVYNIINKCITHVYNDKMSNIDKTASEINIATKLCHWVALTH